MDKKSRLLYPDSLKIIAIFGVIIIHTTAVMLGSYSVSSWKWQVTNIFSSLVRFSVPVFFMASGIFFLDPAKDITIRKIYTKYIPRLIVALIFWGIAYEVYLVILSWMKTQVLHPSFLIAGLIKVATGHGHFHLYFIYLIVGLYVITPILRVFIKHATRQQIEYFLLLFFLFSGFFPLLFTFPPFSRFSSLILQMRINVVCGYVGYFVAGYYFDTFSFQKRTTKLIYILGISAGIMTLMGTFFLSDEHGKLVSILYEGLSPNVMLMSFAVFLFVKNCLANGIKSKKQTKQIAVLSKCTFGIYLIHDFFNITFKQIEKLYNIHLMDYNPLITIPIYTLVVFLLSLGITAILLKIPVVNKYLV